MIFSQENCTVTFINGTFAGFAASTIKRIGRVASANLQPKFEVNQNFNVFAIDNKDKKSSDELSVTVRIILPSCVA